MLICIFCCSVLGHGTDERMRSEDIVPAMYTDKVGRYVKITTAISPDQPPPAYHVYLLRLKCYRVTLKLTVESDGDSDIMGCYADS